MATLIDVLNELLHQRRSYMELTGGLRMQYRPADDENPACRLLCYRIGTVGPSDRELVTVRQHLEKLLPAATAVRLEPEFSYIGSDGLTRYCRVFIWQPAPAQASLFGGA